MKIQTEKISSQNINAILEIQALCYTEVPLESSDVILEKTDLFPDGCFLAKYESSYAGYILSHPWSIDYPPKINHLLKNIPKNADCFYIHDLAISPCARGIGIATQLLQLIYDIAKNKFSKIALISVESSFDFWSKNGFVEYNSILGNQILSTIKEYQPTARYMFKFI